MAKETELKTTAQDFTAAWVDLGSEINTYNTNTMLLYLNLDINDSANCRIRCLAKRISGGADEYTFPIKSVGTTDVGVESRYFEFTTDADNKIILEVSLKGLVPYVQLQIQCGTVGATAGQIDSVYAFLK